MSKIEIKGMKVSERSVVLAWDGQTLVTSETKGKS